MNFSFSRGLTRSRCRRSVRRRQRSSDAEVFQATVGAGRGIDGRAPRDSGSGDCGFMLPAPRRSRRWSGSPGVETVGGVGHDRHAEVWKRSFEAEHPLLDPGQTHL